MDRNFAKGTSLPSALRSAKRLFAARLCLALDKEVFAKRVTWLSAKGRLCRVLLARLPVVHLSSVDTTPMLQPITSSKSWTLSGRGGTIDDAMEQRKDERSELHHKILLPPHGLHHLPAMAAGRQHDEAVHIRSVSTQLTLSQVAKLCAK